MDDLAKKHRRIDYLIGVYLLVLTSGLFTPLALAVSPRGQLPPPGNYVQVGSISSLPDGGSMPFRFRGSPCLAVNAEGSVFAASALCPLDGALLSWDPSRRILSCPVSGDTYDPAGNHLSGISPHPLRTFEIRQVGRLIFATGGES